MKKIILITLLLMSFIVSSGWTENFKTFNNILHFNGQLGSGVDLDTFMENLYSALNKKGLRPGGTSGQEGFSPEISCEQDLIRILGVNRENNFAFYIDLYPKDSLPPSTSLSCKHSMNQLSNHLFF